jgi:hypothetical protein
MTVTVTYVQPSVDSGAADSSATLSSQQLPAPVLEHDDDIYGPASFPASDPPGSWAGRDLAVV